MTVIIDTFSMTRTSVPTGCHGVVVFRYS